MVLFHLLFPLKLATSNYSAQFKEKDSDALTLGDDFQVQVKIIPFADCCVAYISLLSYCPTCHVWVCENSGCHFIEENCFLTKTIFQIPIFKNL